MITGFNTDIEFDGVVYHVQTEDKGVSTPLILSLVYNRGTILASKRSPYDDLLVPAFDEKALSERLQKQHKLICAAVSAGRIEDLKRMTKSAAQKPKPVAAETLADLPVEEKAFVVEEEKSAASLKPETPEKIAADLPPREVLFKDETKTAPPQTTIERQIPAQKVPIEHQSAQAAVEAPKKNASVENKIDTKIVEPKENPVLNVPLTIVDEEEGELIVEAVEIIEEETILAAEAVAVLSDEIEIKQTVSDELKIRLPDDATFRSGERKTVNISVYRGEKENASSGAHVMIKVFGAAFRPLIFHAKTDARGTANVHLQMPQFKGGRAAILIRAMSDGEETELRRVIVS